MKIGLLFSILVCCVLCSQYVPIMKTVPGIHFTNPNSQTSIQFVIDPMCADSADFDQNIIRPLLDSFDSDTKNKFDFSYILYPLPFHMTSQKVSQGIYYIMDNKGVDSAVQALRYIFDNIPDWDE